MVGKIVVAGSLPTHRIMLRAVLTAASYQVHEATEPGELLQMAERVRPDLIVMDAPVEDQSWVRAMADCRTEHTTRTPVLAIDRDYSPASRLLWLAAGASDVIPAPVDQAVLRARLRTHLRARSMETEAAERVRTAHELGFHEAAATFTHAPKIVIASANSIVSEKVISAIADQCGGVPSIVRPDQLFAATGNRTERTDMIILLPYPSRAQDALTAISEIRTRRTSRSASIVLIHDPADRATAVSALDLGANDAIEADSTEQEIAVRIGEQLRQRAVAEAMRAAMRKGLELASTDPLTGIYNRRYAMAHLNRISARANATRPFAVLALDMDHFKQINDQFGHAAGDAVLVEVAERLRENLRSADLVARMGGEEFLIIMPDTDLAAAKRGAERLRQVISTDPIHLGDHSAVVRATASIGVAAGTGSTHEDAQDLLRRADAALYAAKGQGRNLVETGQYAA